MSLSTSDRRRPRPEPPTDREPEPEPDPAPESVARTIALTALTTAPRTRAQLAGLMAKRDVPEPVATDVLDRFTEVGLIDDPEFARAWVDSRHAGRGLGRRVLREELRRRGVDPEVTAEALDQVSADDELEAARRLVRRKLQSLRGVDGQRRDRRLLGMLARRGHGSGVAWAAIRAETRTDAVGSDGVGSSGVGSGGVEAFDVEDRATDD